MWWFSYNVSSINPFPHTEILQQMTLNVFCQKIENLHNWRDNLWQKVENIVAKEEIAQFVQFLLLSLCFSKSRLLQRCQKASIWGKGLMCAVMFVQHYEYWNGKSIRPLTLYPTQLTKGVYRTDWFIDWLVFNAVVNNLSYSPTHYVVWFSHTMLHTTYFPSNWLLFLLDC